jgi:RecA-family ATPase
LFKISGDRGVLKTTKFYDQFVERLGELSNLKLIVVDTKTRFSPGEGEGNVTATQEITYYEAIARKTGATVMLLHHSNKKSRDGSQDGATAYRDATAIFDSVRAAWYLRPADNKEIEGNREEGATYQLLENAKNNYIKQCENIIVVRNGYKYVAQAASKGNKKEKEDIVYSGIQTCLLTYLQSSRIPEHLQAELVKVAEDEIKAKRNDVKAVINNMCEDGLLEEAASGKRSKSYSLTAAGVTWGLSI